MHRLRVAVASALILVTAACAGTAPDPGPRFDDESTGGAARDLTCMKHQPEPPGARYTDGTRQRTTETLALLRYYTANGAKPYCDGRGPSGIDRQWVDVYVRLGADRENVAPLLDDQR
jgi:hypothetical protein